MVNLVALHGRLTADPELRHTANGTAVCGFTVACSTGYGDKKQAHYIDCVAWRQTAEFLCQYFCKGKEIVVSGQLQTRTFEDRQGNKRKATEVLAQSLDFCGQNTGQHTGRAADQDPSASHAQGFEQGFMEACPGPDDDLPF